MKNTGDIKTAFDAIKPTEEQKQRMLDNVLSHSGEQKSDHRKLFQLKRVAAVFIVVVFAAGGIFAIKNFTTANTPLENTTANGGRTNDDAFPAKDSYAEDMIAPLTDQFKIGNKTYFLLSDYYRESVGFPKTISDSDIGKKIDTIRSGADKSLIGCDVYFYKPAGCQAVVAVKQNQEYKLFKFLSFDSYNNNQDEDAAVYLDLYGIKSAGDILKIQFIGYSEQAKLKGTVDVHAEISDKSEIAKFYGFYSVLKNSSDKYFDKLFKTRIENIDTGANDRIVLDQIEGGGKDEPVVDIAKPDYAQDSIGGPYVTPQRDPDAPADDYDEAAPPPGSGETTPSPGSVGTNALANSATIRIYNLSGMYYDTEYYPNIGFISRYEITDEFAEFLASYIK